jgi:hypothetical protein
VKIIFNKKNLTILGIILVILGIPLTILILKNQTIIKSNALDSQEPKNIKITNISEESFTVTYQTDLLATGSLSYGLNKKLTKSELDDMDKEKKSFTSRKIHSISVKELTPTTKYYLTIISDSDTYLNNNSLFEVKTGPEISSASAKEQIIKGKILLPDGNPSSDTLVYLNAENSQFLSSITTKSGEFSFSLSELRTKDLSSFFKINKDTVFKIFTTNGSLSSTATVFLKQTNFIPIITLSHDYDFIQEISPTASMSGKITGFPLTNSSEGNLKPEITNPKENQTFSDQKPQFRGKSLPNEKVEIIIHSEEGITTEVIADSNGNWTYQPPTNLSPGAHTITIRTRDSSGILRTIVQSFTVFAAETQITPILTAKPTLTPTPTPTTIILLPSPTSIPSPTSEPLPTQIVINSNNNFPPTGNPPTSLCVAGITTILAGLSLLIFTRKTSYEI